MSAQSDESSESGPEPTCVPGVYCDGLLDKCDVTIVDDPDAPVDMIVSGSPACVIDELLSSTPSTALVTIFRALDPGYPPHFFEQIYSYGDGTIGLSEGITTETNAYYTRLQVRPAEHFAACRASLDPVDVRACLLDYYVPGTCMLPLACPVDEPVGDTECAR